MKITATLLATAVLAAGFVAAAPPIPDDVTMDNGGRHGASNPASPLFCCRHKHSFMCHGYLVCREPELEKGQKFLKDENGEWVIVDEDGTVNESGFTKFGKKGWGKKDESDA